MLDLISDRLSEFKVSITGERSCNKPEYSFYIRAVFKIAWTHLNVCQTKILSIDDLPSISLLNVKCAECHTELYWSLAFYIDFQSLWFFAEVESRLFKEDLTDHNKLKMEDTADEANNRIHFWELLLYKDGLGHWMALCLSRALGGNACRSAEKKKRDKNLNRNPLSFL